MLPPFPKPRIHRWLNKCCRSVTTKPSCNFFICSFIEDINCHLQLYILSFTSSNNVFFMHNYLTIHFLCLYCYYHSESLSHYWIILFSQQIGLILPWMDVYLGPCSDLEVITFEKWDIGLTEKIISDKVIIMYGKRWVCIWYNPSLTRLLQSLFVFKSKTQTWQLFITIPLHWSESTNQLLSYNTSNHTNF